MVDDLIRTQKGDQYEIGTSGGSHTNKPVMMPRLSVCRPMFSVLSFGVEEGTTKVAVGFSESSFGIYLATRPPTER